MPKAAHAVLERTAKKKFPGNKKRQDRYVFGSPVMQDYRKKKRKPKKTHQRKK